MRRLIAAGAFTATALALGASPGSASPGAGSRSDLKNFQHVRLVMMENTGYDSLIGNPSAPWINQAATTYGLATNSFGVTNPSQSNYIALTSGSTNGLPNDNDITIDVHRRPA
jgi:acid phosphatase